MDVSWQSNNWKFYELYVTNTKSATKYYNTNKFSIAICNNKQNYSVLLQIA